MKFDTFLATVGDWGKFQKVKYTLICLTYMLPPIMVYTYTFTAATPNFRCENPSKIFLDDYSQFSNDLFNENFRPRKEDCLTKSISLKECQRCYRRTRNQTLEYCQSYVYDKFYYKDTLIEEV